MPRCSQLNLFVKNYFPLADFVNLEIVMMSYFHWNLVRHFLVHRISRTLAVPTTFHWAGLLNHTKQVILLSDVTTRRFQLLTTPPRSYSLTQYYRRIYTTVNNNDVLQTLSREDNTFSLQRALWQAPYTGGPIVHQGRAADYFAEYVNFFLRCVLHLNIFICIPV